MSNKLFGNTTIFLKFIKRKHIFNNFAYFCNQQIDF